MKKKFFAGLTVLLGVSLFVLGCDPGTGGGDDFTPVDNAVTGQMSAATANAIFGSDGWGEVTGGVEIKKFKSAKALDSYLTSSSLAADPTAIFVINTIDNKHVVKIGAEAFKPDLNDSDTFISKVVAEIRLPATITELEADVFSGVDAEVVIPKAVIAVIVAAANGEDGTKKEAEVLQESLGKTVTIAKAEENGEVNAEENIEPTEEPEKPPVLGGSNALNANSIEELAEHIKTAKNVASTVTIKLTAAFYEEANGKSEFIAIDAGVDDNTKHYIIKGLGKDGTALTVGILLANDNITLAFVKVNVETTSKAAPCSWEKYKAAVSIGRATVADSTVTLLTGADLASSNVTIQNCDITSTANADGFTAGVYVCGTYDSTNNAIYPSANITLSGNTITAKGHQTQAVQAVNIHVWHPTVAITDNTITAHYGTKATPGLAYCNAPASAIYAGWVLPKTVTGMDNTTVNISGNTLVADAYSFYFNACETVAEPTDKAGVTALRGDNFSVAATTWALTSATDTDSTFKKLFNALLDNIAGYGFAFVGNKIGTGVFEAEQYEIKEKKVYAISVYGDHIVDGEYKGDTPATANAFSGSGSAGYDYGRKLANDPNNYNIENNKFCYGPASEKVSTDSFETAGNYAYDTDLTP
jgi:hypothetical protein